MNDESAKTVIGVSYHFRVRRKITTYETAAFDGLSLTTVERYLVDKGYKRAKDNPDMSIRYTKRVDRNAYTAFVAVENEL